MNGRLILLTIYLTVISFSCEVGKFADPGLFPVSLVESELGQPLAKYYHQIDKPTPEETAKIKKYDNSYGLRFEDINLMLEPGYLPMEMGYTKFKDGTGLVAATVDFKNSKGKMLDWWFDWVGYDVLRYKIWYPGLHASALYEGYPVPKSFSISDFVRKNKKGKTKRTIEAMVNDGPLHDIEITFIDPSQFGIDTTKLNADQWAFCANVKSGGKLVVQMVHFARSTSEGFELRSRFWIGREIFRLFRPIGVTDQDMYELTHHCLHEFTQLASFLPQVYARYNQSF